ncbi:MAG: TatD family hydrolase [Bacteroidales bacterium]|jgi:TatD DNase family protein|nr:TatD family hydrolase [Bacteroidales bacterium]
MNLIDTHTHIYLPEFDNDRDEVIERALGNGVSRLLMPNIDLEFVERMHQTATRYPDVCQMMIGLHPTSVGDDFEYQLEAIERLSAKYDYKAIGEIGIDLYWDKSHLPEQVVAFRKQVALAISLKLPVVIHSRDSFPQVSEALEEFKGQELRGVFHAFTGTSEDARRAVEIGFMIGIGGIVTFKNSGLAGIVREVGLDNIILETDSPYLAPVPYRGKRNESSYLCHINNKIAEIFGLTPEETASATYKNSVKLFDL